MVKNPPKKEIINSSFVSISCDIISNFIIPYLEFQAIGRLGQTCKSYHQCYCDKVECKIPHCPSITNACDSLMCRISAQDFDANTDILEMYAKKYEKSEGKDIHALSMIHHLWYHHAPERFKGVADVLEKQNPTMQECIQLYAGNYDTLIKRCIKNEKKYSLSEDLLISLGKSNIRKIERFIEENNLIAIKTMFLTDLELAPQDSDHRRSFLQKLYVLPYISIFKKFYVCSNICWQELIMCAVFCKEYEPIFNIMKIYSRMKNNEGWVRYQRFEIWKKIVCYGIAALYPVVDLLFADDINAVDLQGYGLLYYAVKSQRVEAVRFLLNKKINVNQVCDGETALQRAIDSSEITSLLLQHDAHVNCQDQSGYTPLMNSIFHFSLHDEMESVLDLLLKYGADVNILTDNNDSVFHMLALSGLRYDVKKMWRIISLLIEHGAIIDIKNNFGKTALDYANCYGNNDLVTILKAELAKKVQKDTTLDEHHKSEQLLFLVLPTDQTTIRQKGNKSEKSASYYKKVLLYSIGLTMSAVMGYFLWQYLVQ